MKKTIFILSLLLCSISVLNINAQDLTQGQPTVYTEKAADKELKTLTKKLALTGKQQKLTQVKLTEFAMSEKKIIESDMTTATKKEQIKALNINKIKEMRGILTGPQYDKYLRIIKNKRKANKAKILKE